MSANRTKPPGCYIGKEDAFQVAAINLARLIATSNGVKREAVMHIPNGGARHIGVARKLKAQGVVPGYADLNIWHKEDTTAWMTCEDLRERYCGLALELKVWPNNVSDAQIAVHAILRDCGWRVAVCYGLDEVEAEVRRYLHC